MRRTATISLLVLAAAGATLHAQGRGGGAWTTVGGDAQRTGWVRTDPRISKESITKGGLQLLWKRQLEKPGAARALSQPVLLPNIISYKGFKALAYVGGAANSVYSIDYDLNRMFWERSLGSSGGLGAGCAASSVAVTRATPLGAAAPAGGRGAGRGQGPAPTATPGAAPPAAAAPAAGTAPGTPGTPPPAGNAPAGIPAGAGAGAPPGAPPSPAPGTPAAAAAQPPAGRGVGGGGGLGGGRGGGNNVYAVSATGMVHALNPQTGEDVNPPAKLTGGGAKIAGAVFIDNVVYAAATENCGTVTSGVYAVDLADNANTVTSWDARGARIAGTVGPAFAADGTVLVATGASSGDASFANAIVALEPRTLKAKGWFTAGSPFTSSPIVFVQGAQTLVAAANADGSVYVIDAASPGGSDHRTSIGKSPQYSQAKDFAAGALATWEGEGGSRWIAVAAGGPLPAATTAAQSNGAVTAGAIVAFKVAGEGSAVTLEPAWTSRDMALPGSPTVLNGVVFAASASTSQSGARPPRSILYAFDAASGKELWNSGAAMASFVPGVPVSAGDGQIYVVTADGTLYAFGVPLEH